jgi:large subunit ribosomal protein L30
MGLILVVNLHGAINSSSQVRKALGELKAVRRFTGSVTTDDESTKGMLKLCKDYVAWCPLDAPLLARLLKERGMVSSTKKLDGAALKELGYGSAEEMADMMLKKELRLNQVKGVLPYLRLAPPKGGFKRSMRRQASDGGLLGSNPGLPEIVGRMV